MSELRRLMGVDPQTPVRPRTSVPVTETEAVVPAAPADSLTLSEDQRLEAGIQRLEKLADELEAKGDRRYLFPRVYMHQLRGFQADVRKPGQYQDPLYMTKLVRLFLDRYFVAFDAYNAGDKDKVPEPWRKSFDEAAKGKSAPLTDLMLGMTAHMTHDLPLALADTHSSAAQKRDYLKFNDVLESNIDVVQSLVDQATPGAKGTIAGLFDKLLGPVDEYFTSKLLKSWRETAWKDAQALQAGEPKAYEKILKRSHQRVSLAGGVAWIGSKSR
jgi:hypothetical protein